MHRIASLACCLILPLSLATAACTSGSGTPAGTTDTVGGSDTTVAQGDTAGPSSDATEIDPTPSSDIIAPDTTQTTTEPVAPNYPDTCTDEGFKAYDQQFNDLGQGSMAYQAVTTTKDPYSLVSFEFYPGSFGGASTAGTYDLTGTNYETCGNCVLVRTGCKSTTGTCAKTYYADQGQLVIDSWAPGGKFSGHLEGVTLQEVTIDPNTYRSTPVVGGGQWCLDQYQFSADVTAPVVGGQNTQPTCVAEGTGTLVHDNIAAYSLANCNGEQIDIHAGCGTTKALWLIGTAGWCSACHELFTAMVADYGGSLSRKIVSQRYPGLDMLIVLGEDQYGELPTPAYCTAYAQDLGIDPAMVLIDNDPGGQDIPLINAPGFALPVNSFATTWAHINPYLKDNGDGTVTTATPWHIVLRGSNMEYMWSDNVGSSDTLDGTINTLLSE